MTPHLLKLSLRIRFGLFPFRSPLLREYLLVSFPSLTWMFPFREFPFLTERQRLLTSDGMSYSGISGSKTACVSPEHIAACRALLQCQSLAIHQLALACQTRFLLNLVSPRFSRPWSAPQAIGDGGLNTSAEALVLTPPFHQPCVLQEPSSAISGMAA